jgi:hypothetical protein
MQETVEEGMFDLIVRSVARCWIFAMRNDRQAKSRSAVLASYLVAKKKWSGGEDHIDLNRILVGDGGGKGRLVRGKHVLG